MDALSETLRADGVVVTGPVRPQATQNFPEPKSLVTEGSWGRWKLYKWDPAGDAIVEDFENVSNHEILLGAVLIVIPELAAANRTSTKQNPRNANARPV